MKYIFPLTYSWGKAIICTIIYYNPQQKFSSIHSLKWMIFFSFHVFSFKKIIEFLVYSSSGNIVVAYLMIGEVILCSIKQELIGNFDETEIDSRNKWFWRETDPIRMTMIKAKLLPKALSCLGIIIYCVTLYLLTSVICEHFNWGYYQDIQ